LEFSVIVFDIAFLLDINTLFPFSEDVDEEEDEDGELLT